VTPPRVLLRRLGLFLAPVVPGLAILAYMADGEPLPPPARANVRTVDLADNPTISVDNLGSSSSVGTSQSTTILDGIQDIPLATESGPSTTRPFREWVLRSQRLEPGSTATTFSVLGVRLEGAKKPRTLAEYEERIASPTLDIIASADEAEFLMENRLWNEARLRGHVDVRATDSQGQQGRLTTDTLICRLEAKHVETEDDVVVERPGFRLEGTGLRADVGLQRRVEVLHDVSLSLDMAEANLPWGTAADGNQPFQVHCDGPLIVEELDPEQGEARRLRVTAEGNVTGKRGEASGIACDSLSLLLRVPEKEKVDTADERPADVQILEIRISRLRPLFLTSTAGDRVRIEGESLEWRRRGDAAWEATVTGSPVVQLIPPESAPELEVEIRCEGPATMLVEDGEGLAEAVFDDGVIVKRGAETLRGNTVSVVRRPETRSLTARGDVTVDGPTLHASAAELQRIENDDGSRKTTLTGAPRLVFSGAAGLGLLGGTTRPTDEKKPEDVETDVSSGGPICLLESPAGSQALAEGGVLIVRRTAAKETGRLRATTVDLRLTAGEKREVLSIDARGGATVEGTTSEDRRFSATADLLNYRRDGERLTLTGSRPHLRQDDARGITNLRGDRITWSRLSGEFEVAGPVEADLPVGVDLLLTDATGTDQPVTLRCGHLAGVLHGDGDGKTASLRSALATGAVELTHTGGRVAGTRLLLTAEEDGFSGRITGSPARIERRLANGLVDILEGPELHAGAGAEGEMKSLLAPKGAEGTFHLQPKEGSSASMTRIDLKCAGAVTVGQTRLDAPGGVEAEHRTWNEKTEEWGPPLKLSGKHMTGTFKTTGPGKARQVETVDLREDVHAQPPSGGELTCSWARILPAEATIEFGGTPDIVWKSARGKIWRARSARYCYRSDLAEGTRLRVDIRRSGGR
jgi:lipopolysaccharide export system protein LptA